jgi:hypothetical protein
MLSIKTRRCAITHALFLNYIPSREAISRAAGQVKRLEIALLIDLPADQPSIQTQYHVSIIPSLDIDFDRTILHSLLSPAH